MHHGARCAVRPLSERVPKLLLRDLAQPVASGPASLAAAFSPGRRVAVDRPFELPAAPVAKALGMSDGLDAQRSWVMGRLARVETRGSVRWLTVRYRVRLQNRTFQDRPCRVPVVTDMTLELTLPEGRPTAEGSLKLEGKITGKVEVSPQALLRIDGRTRIVQTHTKR